MPYFIQFNEITVAPYLRGLDLSREGRIVMAQVLRRELRDHADFYLHSLDHRLSPGSPFYGVDLLFRDPTRDVVHHLHFILSDASASYGVLKVVYVEDVTR